MKIGFSGFLFVFAFLGISSASAEPFRGGSNYSWYALQGCSREPYGVLKNFHQVTDTVDSQLAAMALAGQRRLRIGIFHGRNASTGTVISSTGGNLPRQQRENLAELLASARDAGFVEVIVSLHPVSANDPAKWTGSTWTSADESYFQENWNLVYNLMPLLKINGLRVLIDLGNELSPPVTASYAWKYYAKKMWANYNFVFGKEGTVGFSVPTGSADRIEFFRELYPDGGPYVLDFHLYGDEYNQLRSIDVKLKSINFRQGIVVGEAFYNDAASAQQIGSAIPTLSRSVYYVLQWPMTRTSDCSDVNVAPPLSFSNYISKGL